MAGFVMLIIDVSSSISPLSHTPPAAISHVSPAQTALLPHRCIFYKHSSSVSSIYLFSINSKCIIIFILQSEQMDMH